MLVSIGRSQQKLCEDVGDDDGDGRRDDVGGTSVTRVVAVVMVGLGFRLGLNVAVVVTVSVVEGVVGVDNGRWEVGGRRRRRRRRHGRNGRLVERKVVRENEVSEVDRELAAPDGEPLQVADVQVVGQGQLEVLASIKVARQDGGIRVLVLVELSVEGVGQDVAFVAGDSRGANPEECIGSLSVVAEVLDEEGLFVDGIELALDLVGPGSKLGDEHAVIFGSGQSDQE